MQEAMRARENKGPRMRGPCLTHCVRGVPYATVIFLALVFLAVKTFLYFFT